MTHLTPSHHDPVRKLQDRSSARASRLTRVTWTDRVSKSCAQCNEIDLDQVPSLVTVYKGCGIEYGELRGVGQDPSYWVICER